MRERQQEIPVKSVIFTIDDGFEEQITLGGELFARYDIPLTCFVITDFIDGKLWSWDDQLHYMIKNTPLMSLALRDQAGVVINLDCSSGTKKMEATRWMQIHLKNSDQTSIYELVKGYYPLAEVDIPTSPPFGYRPTSWDAVRRFTQQGHRIAPHSKTHRMLARLSDEESRDEIAGSIQRVREMVSESCAVFAYPTGRRQDYGQREIETLKENGIHHAVDTVAEHAVASSAPFALPRFPLPDYSANFLQYLTYIELLKNKLRRR